MALWLQSEIWSVWQLLRQTHNEDRRASGWSSGCAAGALVLNKHDTCACFYLSADANSPFTADKEGFVISNGHSSFYFYFCLQFPQQGGHGFTCVAVAWGLLSQRGDAGSLTCGCSGLDTQRDKRPSYLWLSCCNIGLRRKLTGFEGNRLVL